MPRPRSPDVARQAEALLRAHASGAEASREGVFLICHPEDREPARRVRTELERHGVRVVNRSDASAWESCHEDAESASGLLVLLGTAALDAEQVRHTIDYYDDRTARALRLPGSPRPVVPADLDGLEVVDLENFSDVAGLAADLLRAELRLETAAATESAPAVATAPVLKAEESFTEPLSGEVFLPVPAGRFEMGGSEHERAAERGAVGVRGTRYRRARLSLGPRGAQPGAGVLRTELQQRSTGRRRLVSGGRRTLRAPRPGGKRLGMVPRSLGA